MPVGVSTTVANYILGLSLNGTAWSGFNTIYAQLHVGQPGPNGTANVAGNNLRVSCGGAPSFATPNNGQTSNNNQLLWSNVTTNETYAFCSLWSALTLGTFIVSGTITAQSIVAGNNFSIPAGGLVISLAVAS